MREFKNRRKTLAKENVESPHQPRKPLNRQQPIQLPRLPSSAELKQAETVLIKTVQSENFATEIATLHSTEPGRKDQERPEEIKLVSSRSLPWWLWCFTSCSNQDFVEKHPAILPKGHHLSHLVITHHHEKVYHQGRQITSGAIRQAGYWIVWASRMVSQSLNACVACRKLWGKTLTQHMADLPPDRLETPPPFTNVGFDVFGPWIIHTQKLRGGR